MMRRWIKVMVALLLAGALGVAQASDVVEPVAGPWSGAVDDARTETEYSMSLMVWRHHPAFVTGIVVYETGCIGILTHKAPTDIGGAVLMVHDARAGQPAWFAEVVHPDLPSSRCKQHTGIVAIVPRRDGTAVWRRVRDDGRILAEAQLARRMPDRELDAAVKAHIAVIGPATAPRTTVSLIGPGFGGSALKPTAFELGLNLPFDRLRQATVGRFSGALADCGGPPSTMELVLREQATQSFSDALQIEGSLRIVQTMNDGKPRVYESAVHGVARTTTGAISLNTGTPAPPPGSPPPKPPSALGGLMDRITGRSDKPPSDFDPVRGEPMPFHRFSMLLSRDLPGQRWKGTLNDGPFSCHEVDIARTDGSPSSVLPMQSVEDVVAAAALGTNFVIEDDSVAPESKAWPERRPMRAALGMQDSGARTPYTRMYWLRLAGEMGDGRAAAMAGRIYEFGLGVPKDEVRAVAMYRMAASKGDPEGLRALGRMSMAQAGGLPSRDDEARALTERADRIVTGARSLCARVASLETIGRLIEEGSRMSSNSLAATLAGALIGLEQRTEMQGFGIERIDATAVVGAAKPFICKVTGRRINARVTDLTPYKQWAHFDRDGRFLFYSDNEADRQWNQFGADLQTFLLNHQPFIELFQFRQQADGKWRITLLDHDTFGRLTPKAYVEVAL